MAVGLALCQGKGMDEKDKAARKAERLAAQLRDNLRKRKEKARAVARSIDQEPAAPQRSDKEA